MALNQDQKDTAAILTAQGETPERVAAYLGVPTKDVTPRKTTKTKPADEQPPADEPPADED